MAASLEMVCCVNDLDVFQRRLMASDCFSSNRCSLTARFSVSSAAEAFNPVIMGAPGCQWLVWVHQDVFLPPGWDVRFMEEVAKAESRWPTVSVVGVYGISGSGPGARRLGHVLDRGAVLCESPPLPSLADSVDELLFAVRTNSGLRLDERLGFDFYATDLILTAQSQGQCAVVVDAYCEHWSDTPHAGTGMEALARRIMASAQVFEEKWKHRFPIKTSCFDIANIGDVRAQLNYLTA